MKRKNKILACTLSAMLLVSSMAVPVFAAESEQNFDILSSPISIDQNKDQKIDESIAKDTLYSFLTKLKEGKVAEAEEYMINEMIMGDCNYSDIYNEDPLLDFNITEEPVTFLDDSTVEISTTVSMKSGEQVETPFRVSIDSGKYKVHLINTKENESTPYTILEEASESSKSPRAALKDTYRFWQLYGSIQGQDTFETTAGSLYTIMGSQYPDGWPGGDDYPITMNYYIVETKLFGQDTYGSTTYKGSGLFRTNISGSKTLKNARIVIQNDRSKNPEPMRAKGDGNIYLNS